MKSSVRLIGDESAFLAIKEDLEENWVTERVREICKVLEPTGHVEVLGAVIGTTMEGNQFFDERLAKII